MRRLSLFFVLISLLGCGSTPGNTSDGGTTDGGNTDGGSMMTQTLTATKITPSSTIVPAYISVLPNGNIVIADYTTPGVFEMKPDGMIVTSNTTDFSVGGNTPSALSAKTTGGVAVRRGFKGVVFFSGAISTAPVDFLTHTKDVNALTWGADGKFYTFTGRPNGKLEVYSSASATAAGAGTTVASIAGTIGSIAVDASGTAYVLDGSKCSIIRVKSNGDMKSVINDPAAGSTRCAIGQVQEGYIGQASALALDAQNRLVVADAQNHRVIRIVIGANDATTTTTLYENEALDLADIAVAPNGDIFFVESKSKAVWRLAP